MDCYSCKGSGYDPLNEDDCATCGGSGRDDRSEICPACGESVLERDMVWTRSWPHGAYLCESCYDARHPEGELPRKNGVRKGSRVLYHVGKQQPIPRLWKGHVGPNVWEREEEGLDGVWLTPNYSDVAFAHSKRGHVYAYEVPISVIRRTKGRQLYRPDRATEVFIPASLWPEVRFLGKALDAADLREEMRLREKEEGLLSIKGSFSAFKNTS